MERYLYYKSLVKGGMVAQHASSSVDIFIGKLREGIDISSQRPFEILTGLSLQLINNSFIKYNLYDILIPRYVKPVSSDLRVAGLSVCNCFYWDSIANQLIQCENLVHVTSTRVIKQFCEKHLRILVLISNLMKSSYACTNDQIANNPILTSEQIILCLICRIIITFMFHRNSRDKYHLDRINELVHSYYQSRTRKAIIQRESQPVNSPISLVETEEKSDKKTARQETDKKEKKKIQISYRRFCEILGKDIKTVDDFNKYMIAEPKYKKIAATAVTVYAKRMEAMSNLSSKHRDYLEKIPCHVTEELTPDELKYYSAISIDDNYVESIKIVIFLGRLIEFISDSKKEDFIKYIRSILLLKVSFETLATFIFLILFEPVYKIIGVASEGQEVTIPTELGDLIKKIFIFIIQNSNIETLNIVKLLEVFIIIQLILVIAFTAVKKLNYITNLEYTFHNIIGLICLILIGIYNPLRVDHTTDITNLFIDLILEKGNITREMRIIIRNIISSLDVNYYSSVAPILAFIRYYSKADVNIKYKLEELLLLLLDNNNSQFLNYIDRHQNSDTIRNQHNYLYTISNILALILASYETLVVSDAPTSVDIASTDVGRTLDRASSGIETDVGRTLDRASSGIATDVGRNVDRASSGIATDVGRTVDRASSGIETDVLSSVAISSTDVGTDVGRTLDIASTDVATDDPDFNKPYPIYYYIYMPRQRMLSVNNSNNNALSNSIIPVISGRISTSIFFLDTLMVVIDSNNIRIYRSFDTATDPILEFEYSSTTTSFINIVVDSAVSDLQLYLSTDDRAVELDLKDLLPRDKIIVSNKSAISQYIQNAISKNIRNDSTYQNVSNLIRALVSIGNKYTSIDSLKVNTLLQEFLKVLNISNLKSYTPPQNQGVLIQIKTSFTSLLDTKTKLHLDHTKLSKAYDSIDTMNFKDEYGRNITSEPMGQAKSPIIAFIQGLPEYKEVATSTPDTSFNIGPFTNDRIPAPVIIADVKNIEISSQLFLSSNIEATSMRIIRNLSEILTMVVATETDLNIIVRIIEIIVAISLNNSSLLPIAILKRFIDDTHFGKMFEDRTGINLNNYIDNSPRIYNNTITNLIHQFESLIGTNLDQYLSLKEIPM